MSKKTTGKAADKPARPERKALMLRLDEPLKRKLQQHCASLTKKEGRTVTYNEVVTQFVRGL
jgi:hypothetical protein